MFLDDGHIEIVNSLTRFQKIHRIFGLYDVANNKIEHRKNHRVKRIKND